jgi:hypothetical protein
VEQVERPNEGALVDLTRTQLEVLRAPVNAKIFLHGPAGSGKTTVGVERLRYLFAQGVPGEAILVLAPQRTLLDPYLVAARSPQAVTGSEVLPATLGGLARRICDLFWPLAGEAAGFASPDRPPLFLTLETSQYYMAHIVRPLLDQGYFESVTMDRNRLYSQILDSLNKSAAVGFPYQEIGSRLDAAWVGDPVQRRIYADAQDCATRFRQFCLRNNLLDFSLQLEVFWSYLWPHGLVRRHLLQTYKHLIYDNVEEDVPRSHDLIREWLPDLDSALLIYDEEAGYRRFLGADTETGSGLRDLCDRHSSLRDSFVMSTDVERLGVALASAINPASTMAKAGERPARLPRDPSVLQPIVSRFYPELLDKLVGQVNALISEARYSPAEIVLVAPYLSDALRFAITSRLENHGIPWRTHRPSRSLRDEPVARSLLTIAALAHPHWNLRPAPLDVSHAFMLSMGMDLVRAQLLSAIVYRTKDVSMTSFDQIAAAKQERITYVLGARYTRLRDWILAYRELQTVPLDHFLRRLFGELLSQPGFGLHASLDGARVAASLIESVHKFRLAMEPSSVDLDHPDFDFGREYVAMLEEGVLAAQYLESWRTDLQDSVLVAPAYSFLMMNKPAAVQIWLDPGSSGWFQRLDQPLTHSRVLSRGWPAGRPWTYAEEEAANLETMTRLVLGLMRRCRNKVILGISNLGETGFEQRGRLLAAFQSVMHEESLQVP